MFSRLKKWWYGVSPQITETPSGGWRASYRDPNHPPPHARFKAAIDRLNATITIPSVAWILGLVALVIAAAIIKWLGLA
jgi:hypothetical protein